MLIRMLVGMVGRTWAVGPGDIIDMTGHEADGKRLVDYSHSAELLFDGSPASDQIAASFVADNQRQGRYVHRYAAFMRRDEAYHKRQADLFGKRVADLPTDKQKALMEAKAGGMAAIEYDVCEWNAATRRWEVREKQQKELDKRRALRALDELEQKIKADADAAALAEAEA